MTPPDTPSVTPPDRPLVGLKEASALTGLSLSTLRRRRDSLRDHGAVRHSDGSWSIPISALVELGMLDKVTPHDTHHNAENDTPRNPLSDTPDTQVADLRVEVERERGLRLAAERELQAVTAHLTTAQQTIRMIEAAPPKVETRVERVEVPTVQRVEVPTPATPRWVWPLVTVAVLVALLAAALTAWNLTRHPSPSTAPATATHDAPPAAWPTPPSPAVTPTQTSRAPVPVIVDPPPRPSVPVVIAPPSH